MCNTLGLGFRGGRGASPPPPLLPPRHVCPHKKKLSLSEFLQNRTIDDKSTLQAIIQIKKNSVQPFFRNRARRVVGATSRGMYM